MIKQSSHSLVSKAFVSFVITMNLCINVLPLVTIARAQEISPSPTVTRAPTITPEPTETATPSATVAPTQEITPTVSVTPTATGTPVPTVEPTETATPSATVTPTAEVTVSPTATPTPGKAEVAKRKTNIPSKKTTKDQNDYITDEIIVKFKKSEVNLKNSNGKSKVDEFSSKHALKTKDVVNEANIVLFTKKNLNSVKDMVTQLEKDSDVEYAQPNYRYKTSTISTNDTFKDLLWGLDNTGQTVNGTAGTADADIDAPEAWNISTGNNVVVAVIDTGVNYTHPDLTANMWDGTACKDENNSTLNNCNSGYDYEDNDKTPLPTYSTHGTHVAGTIGAVKNNSKGVLGVAGSVKIMAIKTDLTTVNNVKSIYFAKYNGAKVINASWGGYYNDTTLKAAIDAYTEGIFVAAAGNDTNNNDSTPMYPCSFTSANIICVAATTKTDSIASFSNYGATTVDVGAPGEDIYSTTENITSSTVYSDSYDSLAAPAIPAGYSSSTPNTWGTYNFGGGVGNVLYGDVYNYPYLPNINSTLTSPTYNLNGSTAARFNFWTGCDTEYVANSDYMALEVSANGSSYTELTRWNEATIDLDTDPNNGAGATYVDLAIPAAYQTANFKYRLRWVTNGSNYGNTGDGCWIDDMSITKYTANTAEAYGYLSGTSMAAPHVAGELAVIMGYKSTLSPAQAKDIILNTGDSLASLTGVTTTGKRINLKSALNYIQNKALDTTYYFPWYDDSDPVGIMAPTKPTSTKSSPGLLGSIKNLFSGKTQSGTKPLGGGGGPIPQEEWVLVANPDTTQTANIQIYFKGVLRITTTVGPGQSYTPQFDEETGGPVKIVSTNGVPIYASERVRYANSFNETLGVPASELTSTYYFTWYDDSDNGGFTREAWVNLANPNNSDIQVDVWYKGVQRVNGLTIPANSVVRQQFDEETGGPVKIVARSNALMYTSEKVIFQSSINEMMGYPDNQLDTTYYFPWYDDSDNGGFTREAWVLVGNPSASQTANIEIYYKGVLSYTGSIAPGSSVTPQFDEQVGGPVQIISTNAVPVYTSERVRFQDSFNETFGVANTHLASTYYYPWYDDSDNGGFTREAWVLVANPTSQAISVDIFFKGQKRVEYSVPAGQSYTPQFDEETGGPVKIVATGGNVYTTERVRFQNSFNEMFGR